MKNTLRKLRKTSFDELLVRSSQLLHDFAERQAWPRPGNSISDDALLGRIEGSRLEKAGGVSVANLCYHFRTRTEPHFFPAFDTPDSTIGELRKLWPEAEKHIIERADRITQGRFDLLGFKNLTFGKPVN